MIKYGTHSWGHKHTGLCHPARTNVRRGIRGLSVTHLLYPLLQASCRLDRSGFYHIVCIDERDYALHWTVLCGSVPELGIQVLQLLFACRPPFTILICNFVEVTECKLIL